MTLENPINHAKITYHAWIRETLKLEKEDIPLEKPQSLQKIILSLRKRNDLWNHTFENTKTLRFAVNHTLCKDMKTIIHHNDTISIFPPFTGG